jgi:hypothetical protein
MIILNVLIMVYLFEEASNDISFCCMKYDKTRSSKKGGVQWPSTA